MCGIAGSFHFTSNSAGHTADYYAALSTLNMRGPDGKGLFQQGPVTLGHRRLSIIDTSCAGDQPMTTSDGRYTIVFNGEIFNYQALQKKYLSAGEQQQLHSRSDTEVFLLLYAKLKEQCFELLEGFFAAAIYDSLTKELVLVRDRFGKKPLLVYRNADKLIFASEMKALLKAGVPKKLNRQMLPLYLQLNYVPQPYSLIEGVQKLRPGHYARICGKEFSEQAFYCQDLHPENYPSYTYEEAQKQLVALMDASVQKRMIADVPLGAFLSGGIDSSVVVALASRHTQKLSTFSIGYKDNPFFDETEYALAVAKKYHTDHTVFSLTGNDFLEHVYDVLNYIDEPFADSSAIPEYILSYYTRKHVTVALSGDGGDEVFAGYNKHAAEWRMRNRGWKENLVKMGGPLWKLLPHSRNNKYTNRFRQLDRFAGAAALSPARRYWKWASFLSKQEALNLLHPELRLQLNTATQNQIEKEFTAGIKGADFNEVLLADMNLVLLSDMLVKVDLMSMANSLEVRSPFLDHQVVDFAFGLPAEYKINARLKKRIVQDAFRHLLPPELYNRPKKGFEIPLLAWLRNELWSLVDGDLLSDTFVKQQGIFHLPAVQQLKKQLHSSSPGDSHATIWALLVFQYWWKHYIEA